MKVFVSGREIAEQQPASNATIASRVERPSCAEEARIRVPPVDCRRRAPGFTVLLPVGPRERPARADCSAKAVFTPSHTNSPLVTRLV
eukprot:4773872-Prymnesium_polylepis.1